MLHPYRHAATDRIETAAVHRPVAVLVVADGAEPAGATATIASDLTTETGIDVGRTRDVGEVDRRRAGGQREQVQVVIVQPGEQGPAGGIDHVGSPAIDA